MKVDLHIHTRHSHDSFLAPEIIVETCRRKGMGAIAITDHQVVLGRQCASAAGGVRGSSMARSISSALYTRLRALPVISRTRPASSSFFR